MAPLEIIDSREDLQAYLQAAIKLEHSTIPPYLFALYSIQPGKNIDAYNIIRVVVVEEMLHLTLAANLLNSIGGTPDLTGPEFVPDYPGHLNTGETDFEVGLERLSEHAIKTFLKIERPADLPDKKAADAGAGKMYDKILYSRPVDLATVRSNVDKKILPAVKLPDDGGSDIHWHFHSIGEFYAAIKAGIEDLCKSMGEDKLFTGDPARQVDPGAYFSGGGQIYVVDNKKTAIDAIDLISDQGEGYDMGVYDNDGDVSHYYRFQQLLLGKYYECAPEEDKPNFPTGPALTVDWEAVYPIKCNPKMVDFNKSEELTVAARSFNKTYKDFLAKLNKTFNGEPALLGPLIKGMMKDLKSAATSLMRNPLPGEDNIHAGPTFQMNEV